MESSYDYILFQKITDNIFFLVLNDTLQTKLLLYQKDVHLIDIQEGNVFSDWVDDVMIKKALMSTKL